MIVDMKKTSLQSHQIQLARPFLIGLKILKLIPAIHLIIKRWLWQIFKMCGDISVDPYKICHNNYGFPYPSYLSTLQCKDDPKQEMEFILDSPSYILHL